MPPEQTIVPFFVPLSVKPCQSRPAPPGAMHRAWSLFAYAERSMVHSIMAGGPATYRHRMLPVGVRTGDEKGVEALARWDAKAEPADEIAFVPARVLLQDLTGVPAIVDFAAMR